MEQETDKIKSIVKSLLTKNPNLNNNQIAIAIWTTESKGVMTKNVFLRNMSHGLYTSFGKILKVVTDIKTERFDNARFNGSDYDPEVDDERLTGQIKRVFGSMMDGNWRTLREISEITKDPESSISAQLRHLRKPRFGSNTVEKQRRGERKNGLFEYRLIVNNG